MYDRNDEIEALRADIAALDRVRLRLYDRLDDLLQAQQTLYLPFDFLPHVPPPPSRAAWFDVYPRIPPLRAAPDEGA